jgi:hypothetical protein
MTRTSIVDGRAKPGHDRNLLLGVGQANLELHLPLLVMPGLDPGIHADTSQRVEAPLEWIAGSSPAMTGGCGFV